MSIPAWSSLPRHLEALHRAALEAADPEAAVRRDLSWDGQSIGIGAKRIELAPEARLTLVALGKAAPGMARAAVGILGDRLTAGLVTCPRGARAEGLGERVRVVGAGHPLPDDGSLEAGRSVAAMLSDRRPEDFVLVLASGGGSALMELPLPGVELPRLAEATRALQRAGADIHELNTVRRSWSRIKGGGLARLAAPARVAALLLSDVVGDDPAAIASGPVVPSPTGPVEARAVLERFGLAAGYPDLVSALDAARREPAAAMPVATVVVVGSNSIAAEAVRAHAESLGFRARIASLYLRGEAREAGRVIGGVAATIRRHGVPLAAPACLVFGGETTVTVRGNGRGGRNSELALGAALELAGLESVAVLGFATDGVDGNGESAGALATGDTLSRARALGLAPDAAFSASDTATFFSKLGDAWRPGPSGTNVNDLAIALVYP
jgi:glycerate 2-kinase